MADTTHASVAAQLTDQEILKLAEQYELTASQTVATDSIRKHYTNSAAVLRDYVRLRRLANAVKAKVNYALYHGETYTTQDAITELHRLLAEAEKGETK